MSEEVKKCTLWVSSHPPSLPLTFLSSHLPLLHSQPQSVKCGRHPSHTTHQLLTKCRTHRRHFDSCPWPDLLSPHACVPSQAVRLLLSQSAPVFSNERTLTLDRSIWFLIPKTHAIAMPISMPVVIPVPVTVPMSMPMILLFVLFCFLFCSFFWRLFFSFLLVENLCPTKVCNFEP